MKTDDLILLDLPDIIQTERLELRVPRAGDSRLTQPAIEASLPEIEPFLDWAIGGQSIEETERFIRIMSAKFILRTDYAFLLLRREDGAFVGKCGAHARNINIPEYEIGYWLASAHTGKGYMTEAVNGLTAYLFDYLHAERVMIRCDQRNQASANVARRAGFKEEGLFRMKERNPNGVTRDMLYFSKLRGE